MTSRTSFDQNLLTSNFEIVSSATFHGKDNVQLHTAPKIKCTCSWPFLVLISCAYYPMHWLQGILSNEGFASKVKTETEADRAKLYKHLFNVDSRGGVLDPAKSVLRIYEGPLSTFQSPSCMFIFHYLKHPYKTFSSFNLKLWNCLMHIGRQEKDCVTLSKKSRSPWSRRKVSEKSFWGLNDFKMTSCSPGGLENDLLKSATGHSAIQLWSVLVSCKSPSGPLQVLLLLFSSQS